MKRLRRFWQLTQKTLFNRYFMARERKGILEVIWLNWRLSGFLK